MLKPNYYDTTALSQYIMEFVKGFENGYETLFTPLWSEIIKASHFVERRKIDIATFEEIVKNKMSKDAQTLLDFLKDKKLYFNF